MIEIFEHEKQDGLEESIKNLSSLAVDLEASAILKTEGESKFFIAPDYGDVPSDSALVYAVLVSADWNKNDDIFTPDECWAARSTPILKPANQNHQKSESDKDNKIIGVIKNSYPVNDKYEIVESQEKLEHLICSINLWERYWPTAVADIKEKIDDGNQYVSMECMFSGFGYGLRAEDGSGPIKLLPRNKDTAKLTKFLRAFKGEGVVTIEDKKYRIGRWLRQVSFTGAGFVDKPANPRSITFNNYVSHASTDSVQEPKFMTISEINLSKVEEKINNGVLDDSRITKEYSMAEVKQSPITENPKVEENKVAVPDEALAAKVTEAEKRCAELQAMCDKVQKEYNDARAEFQTKMTEQEKEYKAMAESLNKKQTELNMLQATIDTMRRTAMASERYEALAAINMTSVLEEADEAKAKEKTVNFTEAEWKTILSMAQKFAAKAAANKAEEKAPVVEAKEVEEVKEEKAEDAKATEAAASAASQIVEPSALDQLKSAFSKEFGKKDK